MGKCFNHSKDFDLSCMDVYTWQSSILCPSLKSFDAFFRANLNRLSTVFMCKDGFTREAVRGRQWRCVKA